MLVHDNLAILLEYPQHLSALSQIPGPGIDFDMNSSACCVGISWDGLPCKGNSRCRHHINEALCMKYVERIDGRGPRDRLGASEIPVALPDRLYMPIRLGLQSTSSLAAEGAKFVRGGPDGSGSGTSTTLGFAIVASQN